MPRMVAAKAGYDVLIIDDLADCATYRWFLQDDPLYDYSIREAHSLFVFSRLIWFLH